MECNGFLCVLLLVLILVLIRVHFLVRGQSPLSERGERKEKKKKRKRENNGFVCVRKGKGRMGIVPFFSFFLSFFFSFGGCSFVETC